MYAGQPEENLFFILLMAAILLALFWNDKVSSGGSGGGSGGSGRSTPDPEPERGPSITAYHKGDQHLGGSFGVQGRFSAGSASNYDIEAELNSSSVRVEANGKKFETQEVNVKEGKNTYNVKIKTSVGKDSDSGEFESREKDEPGESKDPVVRITEQKIDPLNGAFYLRAEAQSRSDADIVATGFVKMFYFRNDELKKKLVDADPPEDSHLLNKQDYYELEDYGKAPGIYRYTAWTKDSKGRTGTYSDSFEIEAIDEHGGGDDGGGPGPGGSGPDIDIEYGAGGGDGSDPTGGTPDPSGDPDGGSGGAQAEILGISPHNSESGIDVKDIAVEIFAQAEPGSTLEMLVIEFEWPTGSKYKNEIDVSGDALRKNENLNFWLENSMSLPVEGNYGLRVSVADNSKNKDSDYGTIVINKKSTSSPMPSIEDLHDQQDREIELFHQGVKELETLHEDTEEQIELETNLLDEAKDILHKLNDLEDVEEAIRNHLITELDGTRNMGPRQLKSMSESELEEMASEAELTTALNEAIASTSFHNSSGSINTARDLSSYVSDLMMEFEDFQDTLNKERQHQARDNSLTQKIESQVEDGLDLEKKNAKLIRSFLDNAGSSTSAR